ncbi:MAG: type II toxin-antitoxin system RelE/ParE family toxin [Bacteroidetes bacterium]|nr:MAG: type II toxin-antitoxin system RelE/ParE family toxin [Bacteroidota bacterium]
MEKEIIWSPRSKQTFAKVIEYLEQEWTEKEVFSFVAKVEKVLSLISTGNIKFRSSGRENVHEVLITKHNLLIYRIKPSHIELLRFYDTRQNPRKKKF